MEGRNKTHSLVTGNITWGMLWFAVPMILGNLLQQFYNIADTLIVGRFLGAKALAAVGSAYTLMIFLTSVLYVERHASAQMGGFVAQRAAELLA